MATASGSHTADPAKRASEKAWAGNWESGMACDTYVTLGVFRRGVLKEPGRGTGI